MLFKLAFGVNIKRLKHIDMEERVSYIFLIFLLHKNLFILKSLLKMGKRWNFQFLEFLTYDQSQI